MTHPIRAWLVVSAAALALLNLPSASQAQHIPSQTSSFAESDLSASQASRVAARKARFEKDFAALRAEKKLTQSQRQAKFEALVLATDADLMAILTPEQRAQVLKRKAINVQFEKDLAALRTNTKMTEEQKRTKFQAMMLTRQNALLATLPPAERARVEKEQQEKMAKMATLRREVEQIGDSIQKSESPAQLKQIQAISQSTRQQEQAVYMDRTLSNQAKASRIEALRLQAQSKIDALLTPEQRSKFARLRALISAPSGQ